MKTVITSLIILASFASALGQNIERSLGEFNELESEECPNGKFNSRK